MLYWRMDRQHPSEIIAQSEQELEIRLGVLFYLEDILGCPVDLVTEKALRPELRPYIEQELIDV